MEPVSGHPWSSLLAPQVAGDRGTLVSFHVVRRRGQPLLLLPMDPRLARQTLGLYPAQTVRARAAKAAFGLWLRLGLSPLAGRIDLRVANHSPFAEFLNGAATDAPPSTGALAGNPAEEGQRIIFLVFDREGRPRRVIKAGHGEPATALIEAELAVLRRLPPSTPGVPRVLGEVGQDGLRAFALDFFAGDFPKSDDSAAPLTLLRAWIHHERESPLGQLRGWHRLREACAREAWFGRLEASLAGAAVHPVTYHGQFCSWNIKVSPRDGSWTALDWERGDLEGVPTWDWFHFVIQPELLVRRPAPEGIVARVDRLLASAAFQDYARATQVAGRERALFVAYVAYMARVIRPAAGLPATRELLRLLVPGSG